ADDTDKIRTESHKKTQEAQKELEQPIRLRRILFCAFCASLWLTLFLCNLRNLRMNFMNLPREFYTRSDVLEVARDLLGKKLVVPNRSGKRVAGIIVETEAYRGPEDRASHAWNNRRTNRTETMYGIGGTAYVYFVYGM